MKNHIILCASFLLFGCGGGSGGPVDNSSSSNNGQTNNITNQLVSVTCQNGQIVKGKTSNDYSNCPDEKKSPVVLSFSPSKAPTSSYDPVIIKFNKPIKYGAGECSISPVIPNVECKVDFSFPSNQITAKNINDSIIYSYKYSNQYTVTFSELRDENNLKIADVKVSFPAYTPLSSFTKNGNILATKDHLLNRCEKAAAISTLYGTKCFEGLAFTGTTDPLNNEYCELSFNQDGSISYFSYNENYRTIPRSSYMSNKSTSGFFNFNILSNADIILTASLDISNNNFNGEEFSVLLNISPQNNPNFNQFKFDSKFNLTNYKNYIPINDVSKKCFINSI